MIESGLVYIHYAETPTAFVGCGALVEGPFIVTCRHVWDQAVQAAGDKGALYICFPPPRGEGNAEFRPAELLDECHSLGNPVPDLVILTAEVPANSEPLPLARAERAQSGPGYALAGLRRNGSQSPVQDVVIRGDISPRIDTLGLRQFTGQWSSTYWTDRGCSGSPLCTLDHNEVAGVLRLSETGSKPGEAVIHEAFAVPSATIHRHLSHYVVRDSMRAQGVSATDINKILKMIGASDISIAEIRTRLGHFHDNRRGSASAISPGTDIEAAIEAIRERAGLKVEKTNDGGDIEATIRAARDKLGKLDTAGSRKILAEKIVEEKNARRQRLIPLLEEQVAVQRLTYDYDGAVETLKELLELNPNQTWRWIDLGDVFVTTGVLNDALAAFRQALAAADRLAESDPANAEWQHDLSVSHNKIGDVQAAQGDLPAALKSFQAGLAIADRLAKADPANAEWQRDLSVSYNMIGDVQTAQGDLPAALKSYQDSLAIRDRLAKADPANAVWQRDLSVSHEKIGNVQTGQGDLPAALKSYQDSHAIADRLAKADPANAVWQRDLSVSYNKIGDLQIAQGDLLAALKRYQAGLAIRDRLAKADPANAEWQRDLALSFGRVAMVEAKEGLTSQALAGFRRSRDIIAQLMLKSPDNATLPKDLAWFDRQIAAHEKP